jgi:uncharacterized integral membrane protein
MSRFLGIVSILAVVLLAMAFAAANAGNRVTLDLGILTLFRVPVTLVAFSGLLTGMLVMFATGVYSDLKVRRILRERLAQEAQEEQRWTDGSQQDLFAADEPDAGEDAALAPVPPPLAPEPEPLAPEPALLDRAPEGDAPGQEVNEEEEPKE